mgnify:FL=1
MKVSIITVTRNSEKTLQDCFDSVNSQTYPDIEHIVVDGKSTDNSLNLIGNNKQISNYISEEDKNLYDAMNKGIKLATGDLIGILNSDDMFENENVISKIVDSIGDYDAIYSDLCYVKQEDTDKIVRYWKSGDFTDSSFENGWMAPHPTLFAKKEMFEKFGLYNIDLSNSADYEFILRLFYKYKVSVKYLPLTTVKMRVGGVSNNSIAQRLKASKEDRMSWELNGLDCPYFFSIFKPLRKVPQFFLKPQEITNE